MSLILLLSFFGLGNVGTQCLVRWISWSVKGLMTPFSKHSSIVVFTSVSNMRLSLCVGAVGFGTECNGALTPFKCFAGGLCLHPIVSSDVSVSAAQGTDSVGCTNCFCPRPVTMCPLFCFPNAMLDCMVHVVCHKPVPLLCLCP